MEVRQGQDIQLGSFGGSLADKSWFGESSCPGNQIWVEGMDLPASQRETLPQLCCVHGMG